MKIAQRLSIDDRLGGHERPGPRCPCHGLGALGVFKRLVGELAGDDLFESNVGERRARTRLYHRPMAQAELTHTFGDNVDQELLVWDHLSCFLEKVSRHITQGSNRACWLGRELENGGRGRKDGSGEHTKQKTNRDFAGAMPGCQTDLLTTLLARGASLRDMRARPPSPRLRRGKQKKILGTGRGSAWERGRPRGRGPWGQ